MFLTIFFLASKNISRGKEKRSMVQFQQKVHPTYPARGCSVLLASTGSTELCSPCMMKSPSAFTTNDGVNRANIDRELRRFFAEQQCEY